MANYPYASEPLASGFPEGILTSTLNEDTAVGGLIDNHTTVNKAGIKATLGRQISLIQNFVNSRYLGRDDLYISDAYIDRQHVDTLMPTGTVTGSWDSQGDITLCGNLIPGDNLGGRIGTYDSIWGIFYTFQVSSTYIDAAHTSALTSAVGDALYIRSSDHITHVGNLRPGTDVAYDLGLTDKRYNSAYINNTFTNVLTNDNPSGVLLCSNFIPGASGTNNVGTPNYPFSSIGSKAYNLVDPADTYSAINEHRVWVDTSGYLRYGDHPNYFDA